MNHQRSREIFKTGKYRTNKQKLHRPIKSMKEKLRKNTAARYLTFYVCKLVLNFFVKYPSKITFLRMATIRGRNMEPYDVYNVTNSRIFISTFWF